jgi:sugar/nucleoside kinase (ribokinase family)
VVARSAGRARRGTIYVVGNVNVDLILGVLDRWPRIGTETALPHSELRAGGQAGNAGLALAALGARHRVVANIGADALGRWLRGAFPGSGPAWTRSSVATTITVGIVHPGGERTFFTTVGHLGEFAPRHVLDQLPEHAAPGDVVLVCGVFLSPLLVAGCRELLELLRGRGFALALDTGWPNAGWGAVRTTVESWLPLIDHVLLNELETTALAGTDDLGAAATWVRQRLQPGASLVVKCGPAGAQAWRGARHLARPAPTVRVVDTIGAGDVFNARYLHGVVCGRDLDTALQQAVEAASAAISTSPRRYAAAGE